jgi:hypothetical protein
MGRIERHEKQRALRGRRALAWVVIFCSGSGAVARSGAFNLVPCKGRDDG